MGCRGGRGVTFFSRAAVAELLAARRRCSVECTIVHPAAAARRILAVLGLDVHLRTVAA